MLDNYFSTGNVYVIDDQKNEASPLVDSLFKHHIPHIYMDGSASKLPKNPKQTRLIFLDLNLKQGTNPLDKKSFKNNHASILNRLLANNSSSYVILVWSKEENSYLSDFKEIFTSNNDEYNLNNRPPLEIISLDKSSFFESKSNDSVSVTYEWKKGQEKVLFQLIEDKLKVKDSFIALSAWESLISKSGSQAVDNLFDLVKVTATSEMDSKLGEIISSLAISFMGFENFSKANNQDKTDAFMLALSELVDDEIDKKIIIEKQPEFTSWSTKKIKGEDKAKLNSKLLTSIETNQKRLTGAVFKGDKKHNYLKMLTDSVNQSGSKFTRQFNAKKIEDSSLTEKDFKAILAKEIIKDASKFIPIEINLTPMCDIVQNKEEYYRIVPGFLIDKKSGELLDTKTDRNYFSPLLFQSTELKECIIVLDFRYLFSLTKKELDSKTKICSLRKSFVDDIQSKLANHVSRLGILYLS